MFHPAVKRQPTINPDGYSIKNCSIIYAPKGQAGEYARLACNPYRGCGHKCIYCYVPLILKISRDDFDNKVIPRKNFINLLQKDLRKYEAADIKEQVLLSFTSDPYNHLDVNLCLTRQVIKNIQAFGMSVCTLTKGGSRALRDIDLFRPGLDSFASTLTTLNNQQSLKWEAGAALPQDRIDTLKEFHNAGILTWVSLEPVYDTKATLEIIRQTHEFVDLYKVGKINYHKISKEIDWQEFTDNVTQLLNELEQDYYLKKDLHPYVR